MPKSRANGIGIHYQLDGEGADIVLIHGLAADLAFWYLHVAIPLARRFRVLTYDLRGHGLSDMPPNGYNSSVMCNDLAALLDDLGIHNAHIVGHSYGGAVALHFAVRFPERVGTLTLADAWVHFLQPWSPSVRDKFWAQWRRRLNRLGVVVPEQMPRVGYAMLEEWARRRGRDAHCASPEADNGQVTNSPGPLQGALAAGSAWSPPVRMLQRWRRLLENTSVLSDISDPGGLRRDDLRRLRAPSMVLCGEFSACAPTARRLAALLPNARTAVVPGSGHLHPITRPLQFMRHVTEFIDCESRQR